MTSSTFRRALTGVLVLATVAVEFPSCTKEKSTIARITVKKEDGSWTTETERLLLMDGHDFNRLGLGLDDLIEGYLQTGPAGSHYRATSEGAAHDCAVAGVLQLRNMGVVHRCPASLGVGQDANGQFWRHVGRVTAEVPLSTA